MSNFIMGMISITVSIIMLSGVVMPTVKGTNTSGWSTGEVALFGLIGLVSIAGLVYGVLAIFGMA